MHAHTHTTSLLLCRSAGLDNTMHLMHPETTFTPECEMALAHSFCTIASINSLVSSQSARLSSDLTSLLRGFLPPCEGQLPQKKSFLPVQG